MQVDLALEGDDFWRIGKRHSFSQTQQDACALVNHMATAAAPEPLSQILLPLHFNFCRTTLKNDVSGMTASGKVLVAFVIRTIAPISRRSGSRPSTVR